MEIKFNTTIADKIRTNAIKSEQLQNLTKFAKQNNMCLSSIPLKDGTTAKILSNDKEYDCLIMKNGKVLTARGAKDNPVNVMGMVDNIFTHIIKRDRAVDPVQANIDSFKAIDDYTNKFEKALSDYLT